MKKVKCCDSINENESQPQQRTPTILDSDTFGPHIKLRTHQPLKYESTAISNSISIKTHSQGSDDSIRESSTDSTIKLNNQIAVGAIEMLMVREKKKLRENNAQLKQIITQQKIKVMVQNFIKKLSRNNMYAPPIDYTPFFNEKQLSFLDTQGIQLNDYFQTLCFVISVFLIITLSIFSTLSLAFKQVENSIIFKAFSSICLIYFLFQIGLNLVTIKFQQGKRLGSLRQIWSYCLRTTLPTDLLAIVVLFIDQFADDSAVTYMRVLVVLKLSQAFEKIQKLEVFFIHNFYYEQYWSLIKVFLFNFSLAHILAVCLVAMSAVNTDDTWMDYKNIYLAPWYQKYAWAYYWATTIMLTVGFGDLTATNYKEAICLTLIEMISCIALAYNINCVGMLISNIRSQDLEKGKNFKVFYKLSRKNDLSQDLEWRINNYIEESSNIKKKFNYEEESQFVEKLPKGLKTQFLKESNKKIFQNLPFFKNLMERTLLSFAQKIELHVCHPEEIIQHIDDPHNLLILKGGEIGFTCKKPGCQFNSTVIDQLKILNIADPILISLGFIRNPRLNYQIKSLAYSVLYFLQYDNVLTILKGSQMDYELYCLLRDKSLNMPDDYQLFDCEICKEKHTKFNCPKLHFIPLKQHVTDRYIHMVKNDKNQCEPDFARYASTRFSALKIYMSYNKLHEKTNKAYQTKRQTQSIKMTGILNKRRYENVQETDPNVLVKEISEIKDFFSRNTAELIKFEMTKAFQLGQGHDEVWIVDSDRMKNYKSYFQSDNSCNLIDKFDLAKRISPDRRGSVLGLEDEYDDQSSKIMESWKKFRSEQFLFAKDRKSQNKIGGLGGFAALIR